MGTATRLPALDFNRSPFLVIWEVTRACALACVHCRADAVPYRDKRELSTEEGFQLIDRVAITNATLNLYGLRARAGFTAERPDVVIESVSNYARMAAGMVRSGVVSLESMRGDAATLRDILNQTEKLPGADLIRIAEVRAEISVLAPTS